MWKMDNSSAVINCRKTNENIQVYARVRPLNARERCFRYTEVVDVISHKEIVTRHTPDSKLTKKFTFDRVFGLDSKQYEVYSSVVAPLIEEVLSGYNCTVFAYGQTGTGKTHTMVGNQCVELKSSWEDDSEIGIIPRALCHLFDELRLMNVEFSMRISYLELYNEELCDLLSSDENTKIRIYDDSTKKGSVIIQGLEEVTVHSKDDVYKLLEKGKERRKTASTLINAQSSRSHTVFSILVHIKECGIDGEEMLKIGKLNLVDLAGSENASKAGNEKGIRTRETVNINQSLLTLGRVITALVERTPHVPYRESKLTRLLQESLGGRTKTSIIATISPGHKDIEETLSTLEYAHRAKCIQNKPEVNQKLTKKIILKEYTEEIDKLKRDLIAARDKNGIFLAEETYSEMNLKMDSQNRELNEKMLLLKALKDELASKEKIFNEVSLNLVEKTEKLNKTEEHLKKKTKILEKTKMRYLEKKLLIESLKKQATSILEVADIATQDTEELHKTIDRRKDVDAKIQTACEKFSERMTDNFEMLDENLKNLTSQQLKNSEVVAQEIEKIASVQSEVLNNNIKTIDNIHLLCNKYLTKSATLEEIFSNSLKNLNQDQKSVISNILEEVKEKEKEFNHQIKEHLLSMQRNNEQQKSSLAAIRDCITEKCNSNNAKLEKHVNILNVAMDEIKKNSLQSLQEQQKITNNLKDEHSIQEEEQKLMQQFKVLQEKRSKCSDNINESMKNLEDHCKVILKAAEDTPGLNKQYLSNHANECKSKYSLFENLTLQTECSIDENMVQCTNVRTKLDNMLQEIFKQTEKVSQGQTKYLENFNEQIQKSENEIKCLRLDYSGNMKASTENISSSLNDYDKCLKDHLRILDTENTSQRNSIENYSEMYYKHMENCQNNLDSFRRSELKTYTATGATPSKKTFVYPKVLAETSPHSRLVNRFRQENDWSDLDTTGPIDEESYNESGDVVSMQETPDAENALNSTPYT